jgi:transcriptional regulator of NAD metabolism
MNGVWSLKNDLSRVKDVVHQHTVAQVLTVLEAKEQETASEALMELNLPFL